MKISVWKCVGSTLPACSPLPRKVAQMVQYIADMLKKLLSLKLAHRLCIVPLGTSCNKILFHKSSILAVKMTIYWISYEVQKESQENLWPIAIFFKFFLLKASVFKNSSRKKCTKRYNTDLIRVKASWCKIVLNKSWSLTLIHLTGVHKRLTLFYKHITLKNKCEKVL